MSIPRPRKIVLLVALVATLALLCCGGSVTALLVGGLTDEGSDKLTASGGCGKAGPIDPDTKLPRIRPYGAEQRRNAAVIINGGADLKMPPRAWVIAVATAMQESRLNNLGNLG
ncbi:MAG: M23 family peptidase, partial [Actinomycetota bacterium]|nr:M23 family peptidase [Actinomycetota bacterium]